MKPCTFKRPCERSAARTNRNDLVKPSLQKMRTAQLIARGPRAAKAVPSAVSSRARTSLKVVAFRSEKTKVRLDLGTCAKCVGSHTLDEPYHHRAF